MKIPMVSKKIIRINCTLSFLYMSNNLECHVHWKLSVGKHMEQSNIKNLVFKYTLLLILTQCALETQCGQLNHSSKPTRFSISSLLVFFFLFNYLIFNILGIYLIYHIILWLFFVLASFCLIF